MSWSSCSRRWRSASGYTRPVGFPGLQRMIIWPRRLLLKGVKVQGAVGMVGHPDDLGANHGRVVGIERIGRFGDQDPVARVDQGEMVAASPPLPPWVRTISRDCVPAVFGGGVIGDSVLQFRGSCHGCVAGPALVQCCDGGVDDGGRGAGVRLAHRQGHGPGLTAPSDCGRRLLLMIRWRCRGGAGFAGVFGCSLTWWV